MQRVFAAGKAPLPQLVPCRGAKMQKYLLYNSVEPEELSTLRELSTIGKASRVPCRTSVSARITWRQAVESPRLGA